MRSSLISTVAASALALGVPDPLFFARPGNSYRMRRTKSYAPMRTIWPGGRGTRVLGHSGETRLIGQRPDEQVFLVLERKKGKVSKVQRVKGGARRAELARQKAISFERAENERILAETRADSIKKKVASRRKVS